MVQEILEYGQYYHLCHRGNNKESLFKEERNYIYFLSLFRKYFSPVSQVFAYCLLPTHFHILLRINDLDQIEDKYQNPGQIWRQYWTFVGTYAKAINNTYQRSGPLFYGKYHKNLLQVDDSLIQLIVWIHQNPEEHGIISDYRLWPFSSYLDYMQMNIGSIISKDVLFDNDLYNTIIGMHTNRILIKVDFGVNNLLTSFLQGNWI